MNFYVQEFMLFTLVFVRVASLLVSAPLFGHQVVPVQYKVALSLFCSYVLFPMVQSTTHLPEMKLAALMVLGVRESLVGILIGFSVGLIFNGVKYAGEIITFEMGMSVANTFDPESGTNTPVMGEFLHLFTLLLFLAVNGHHFIFQALMMSYHASPLNTFVVDRSVIQHLVTITGSVFIIGVKFAAPLLVSSFLANVGLAIMARVMPQANIFAVSFPLKIALGLMVLMTTVPMMAFVFQKMLTAFEGQLTELIKVM